MSILTRDIDRGVGQSYTGDLISISFYFISFQISGLSHARASAPTVCRNRYRPTGIRRRLHREQGPLYSFEGLAACIAEDANMCQN